MRRKNETFTQAVVGFFMAALIVMLGYFTIVISGVDLITGRSRVPVRVVFDRVGGLKDRDNVMYRGTKVGTVEHVEVTPTNLVVTAVVDGAVVLRESCSGAVCSLSMLGGNYLLLEEGEGEIVDPAVFIVPGETPTDWMRDIAHIARNLDELTSGPEIKATISNFQAVGARAVAFADRLEGLSKKASAIADKVYAIANRVERGEGTVGKLLSSDDTVYADIKETAKNARAISDRIAASKAMDEIESGVAAFRQAAEGFGKSDVLAKADELLDSLNAVAASIRDGKGTLGRLANDEKMYNEVEGLIRDVRQVVDNYRDTTPITTFSSLAVGAF